MADTLSITSGSERAELPITEGSVRATDLRAIPTPDGPLTSFDPGFVNTASCHSSITYIDGDAGILEYRGYPVDQLADGSTHLEVAHLLMFGELPTASELEAWENEINTHRFVHENVGQIIESFRYDAHPMAKLMSGVASMQTFYPSARRIEDPESRRRNVVRLIAKMPTLAAWSYRHSIGRHRVYPNDELNYVENFLAMLFQSQQRVYRPDPRVTRAMEVLFILHADHEQNCSTNAVRAVASAGNDLYTSAGAGVGALFGPLHGGANEAVLRMLREIGHVDNVGEFLEGVKNGRAKLMGFGHRVYKNYDPRAKVIKRSTEEVFEVTGINPLLEIAVELERIALNEEYFVKRRLYPNVDFYSGLIYEALRFPPEMFTVLFAVPRTVGWCAQWLEGVTDPEQKIMRPKQIYTGHRARTFVPMDERDA
ncbi:MAG: citrate synthase [Propionibacteriaceae bacterium]|nr:citrate synthase [Propionibacteriaceae bacterium]